MQESTRCNALFSGALHVNWRDNEPGLSCEFAVRHWFLSACLWMKGLLLPSPFSSSPVHLSSRPTLIVTHCDREFSMEWDWYPGVISKSCGKEGNCQKLGLKYSWYLHPSLFTPSYMFVRTHTKTHIHTCSYRHKWKRCVWEKAALETSC